MPKTLLLADDSVTIQKVVGISFASEDITLVTVDNGTAAVAKAKEIHPDIVLADVVMPGMSGYEVCRTLKSDPELRHVPVLLLTGTFEAFDEKKAREVGADGHITKPFEAQALVETVNARLAVAAPKPAPAAAAVAPIVAAAAAAPAASSSLFGDDEPFDFLGEESSEPSGVSRNSSSATDAFAFDDGDELGASASEALESEPLDEALPQITASDDLPDLDEEFDDNADTLPPSADMEVFADDSPAATRVMFGSGTAPADDPQTTRVLFGEPESAGVGTLTAEDAGVHDPLADMIGGSNRPSRDAYDVEATDLGDPFADDPEVAAPSVVTAVLPSAEEPSAEGELFASDEPATDPYGEVRSPDAYEPAPLEATTDATPRELPTRDELHNALEKIAWEAFGDVTDRIVRETVQRVEQICWEVIPKMAEALIREEIRKLKGESD